VSDVLIDMSGYGIHNCQIVVSNMRKTYDDIHARGPLLASCAPTTKLVNKYPNPNVANFYFFPLFLDFNSLSTAWTSFLKSPKSVRSSLSVLLRPCTPW
jgi:hypothetical protein